MIDSLKPYPAMKNSGAAWLGEMPEHWGVRRIRSLAILLNGATPSSNNPEYWGGKITWITPQDLGANSSRYIKTSTRNITRAGYESCAATIAAKGALAISTRAPIGHVAILKSPACVNQGCKLIVPASTSIVPEYLHYGLLLAKDELNSLGQGTTFSELSGVALASFQIPFPPSREQYAIIRFLDHADRRIRQYIRAKEKLIALLEEQNQALVHQAVTGRIDVRTGRPYPAYKPSGVESLGDVPEHWEMRRLRNVAEMRTSNVDKHSREDECPIRLCNYADVYHNESIRSEMSFMSSTATTGEIKRFQIHVGDVLITKDSESWDDIGVPAVVESTDNDLVCGYHLALLRPNSNAIDGRYLCHSLSSLGVADQFYIQANGVTRFGLSQNAIKSVWLTVPPLPEQADIVCFLNENLLSIDEVIDRAQREIHLIREYRIRLIADVVTGKLDVRDAAAALPEVDPPAADDVDDSLGAASEIDAGQTDIAFEEADA